MNKNVSMVVLMTGGGATTHTGEPKIIIINGSLLLSVKRT